MTSRTHARFTASDLGSGLTLEQSGAVVTNDASTDINRMARATQPKSDGRWFAEILLYGDGSFTDNVSVGICTDVTLPSTYVGGDSESYGYRDGEIHSGGTPIQSGLSTPSDGDWVGVYLDLSSSPQTVTWFLNGSFVHEQELPASPSETWHLAVSLGGNDAGDIRAFINSGKRSFKHNPTDEDGWYTQTSPLSSPIRLSTGGYLSKSNDAPPNASFTPAVIADSLTIERRVNFWPTSDDDPSINSVDFTVTDPDGTFDELLTEDVRDTVVHISRVEKGAALSTAERVFTGVLDRVEIDGDYLKRVYLKDRLALLEKPLQSDLFPPNIEALANKPVPINLGAVRNFEPQLVDDTSNKYILGDAAVSSLGDIRIKGDAQSPSPDFSFTTDRKHLEFTASVEGKLTAEVSTLGDASSEGQTDLWGGIGNPFVDASPDDDLPDGWDLVGGNLSAFEPEMRPTGSPWVDFPSENGNKSWIADSSLTLAAGKTYQLHYRWNFAPLGGSGYTRIVLGGAGNNPALNFSAAVFERAVVQDEEVFDTFTVPSGWAGDFIPYIMFAAGAVTDSRATLEFVEIFELPDAFAATSLGGLNLEQWMQEIIQTRAGFSAADWSATDCSAIDSATGYEIGWRFEDSTTILKAALVPSSAFTMSMFADKDGVFRFVRLEDPDTFSSVDFTASNFNLLEAIEISPDQAENLTTSIAARKNWSPYSGGDFADKTDAEVNQATRRALSAAFQLVQTTAEDLPATYGHAELSEPIETPLDTSTDAQAEIDRIGSLFSTVRFIYVIEIPESTQYGIGDIGEITYDGYGLESGKKVQVIGEVHDVFNERVTLVCWG